MSEWDHLDLGNIRATLIRQEDTILFNLIERAQFKRNLAVYQPGADILKGTGITECYTKHLLSETEAIHAKVRAYEHTPTPTPTHEFLRRRTPLFLPATMMKPTPPEPPLIASSSVQTSPPSPHPPSPCVSLI